MPTTTTTIAAPTTTTTTETTTTTTSFTSNIPTTFKIPETKPSEPVAKAPEPVVAAAHDDSESDSLDSLSSASEGEEKKENEGFKFSFPGAGGATSLFPEKKAEEKKPDEEKKEEAKPVSLGFSFGGATQASLTTESKPPAMGFSFTAPKDDKKEEETPKSFGFSFGGASVTNGTKTNVPTTGGFALGTSLPATGFNFGFKKDEKSESESEEEAEPVTKAPEPKKDIVTPATFSFIPTAAATTDESNATETTGFKFAGATTEKPDFGFKFGPTATPAATEESKPPMSGFSFGGAPAKIEESKPATTPTTFGFGLTPKDNESTTTTTTATSGFSFGDNKLPATGFSFGGSLATKIADEVAKPAATTPTTFAFGPSTTSTETKPATSSFTFGGASVTATTTEEKPFVFGGGASNPSTGAGFTFGGGASSGNPFGGSGFSFGATPSSNPPANSMLEDDHMGTGMNAAPVSQFTFSQTPSNSSMFAVTPSITPSPSFGQGMPSFGFSQPMGGGGAISNPFSASAAPSDMGPSDGRKPIKAVRKRK